MSFIIPVINSHIHEAFTLDPFICSTRYFFQTQFCIKSFVPKQPRIDSSIRFSTSIIFRRNIPNVYVDILSLGFLSFDFLSASRCTHNLPHISKLSISHVFSFFLCHMHDVVSLRNRFDKIRKGAQVKVHN